MGRDASRGALSVYDEVRYNFAADTAAPSSGQHSLAETPHEIMRHACVADNRSAEIETDASPVPPKNLVLDRLAALAGLVDDLLNIAELRLRAEKPDASSAQVDCDAGARVILAPSILTSIEVRFLIRAQIFKALARPENCLRAIVIGEHGRITFLWDEGIGVSALSEESFRDRGEPRASSAESIARVSQLTAREREILAQIVGGKPNKNIAADLRISQRTVESHRARIMKKTKCKSLPELVRLADLACVEADAS